MSDETALEIADDCDNYQPGCRGDAAEMLRAQCAEIEHLKATLQAAQDALSEAIRDARSAYDKGVMDQSVRDLPGAIEAEQEIAALKRDRRRVYDLLARIHRDGGQYTVEYGIEKACDDAEARVVAWIDEIESFDAELRSEREECERAVENERVKSVSESDYVYNTAIDHALAAIRERNKK